MIEDSPVSENVISNMTEIDLQKKRKLISGLLNTKRKLSLMVTEYEISQLQEQNVYLKRRIATLKEIIEKLNNSISALNN